MGSVRFRLGAFLLVFAASAAFAGGDLLKWIPAGTEYVVGVDADSLRSLSCFRELTENGSEAGEVLAEFERNYNLRFSDCADLLFVGGGSHLRGLLAQCKVPESELARRLRNFGSRFSLEGEAGRRLYCVRAENPGGGNPVTVGAAYLAPDVVLATERKYVAPFFAALTVPAERRGSRIAGPAGEPLAWCSIDLKSILSRGRKKAPGDLGGALFKGVNLIYAEWNTIGDGEFWRLDAIARCDDGKSAQRFAFAVPTWLQLGGSLLFSDDPVLGREFLKRVRVMPDGDRVILELEIPRPMAERLIRYFGEQAKKRIIPPDPVPQDIRRPRLEGVRD